MEALEAEVRVVGVSPIRCPWCHDSVSKEGTEWVACGSCLARHHSECWAEGAKCASCKAAVSLGVSAPPRAVVVRVGDPWPEVARRLERRARARRRRWYLGAGMTALLFMNALLLLAVVTTAPPLAPFIFSIF